jgi:hypothetical protein
MMKRIFVQVLKGVVFEIVSEQVVRQSVHIIVNTSEAKRDICLERIVEVSEEILGGAGIGDRKTKYFRKDRFQNSVSMMRIENRICEDRVII